MLTFLFCFEFTAGDGDRSQSLLFLLVLPLCALPPVNGETEDEVMAMSDSQFKATSKCFSTRRKAVDVN